MLFFSLNQIKNSTGLPDRPQSYRLQPVVVYMGTIGGAGALISDCIKKVAGVAYEDLGAEALRQIKVENFPVTVINDIYGGDIYEEGKSKYRIATMDKK